MRDAVDAELVARRVAEARRASSTNWKAGVAGSKRGPAAAATAAKVTSVVDSAIQRDVASAAVVVVARDARMNSAPDQRQER